MKRKKIFWYVMFSLPVAMALSFLIVWNVFTVQDIVVEGNEYYSDEQIREFIQSDDASWNTLLTYLKHRFFEMDELAFVDSMEVSLENPHTLKVHVYEKGMIGYFYLPAISQNVYFDTDGFVVETSKETIEGIPRVEGLNCDTVVLYEKLPIRDEKILKSLLSVTKSLQKNETLPEKIQFDKHGEISLDYGNIQVLLGKEDNLIKKIARLPAIFKLPKVSGKRGVLNMKNWTEYTTEVVFEEDRSALG